MNTEKVSVTMRAVYQSRDGYTVHATAARIAFRLSNRSNPM